MQHSHYSSLLRFTRSRLANVEDLMTAQRLTHLLAAAAYGTHYPSRHWYRVPQLQLQLLSPVCCAMCQLAMVSRRYT